MIMYKTEVSSNEQCIKNMNDWVNIAGNGSGTAQSGNSEEDVTCNTRKVIRKLRA